MRRRTRFTRDDIRRITALYREMILDRSGRTESRSEPHKIIDGRNSEADEIGPEELSAAAQVYDDLVAGCHYEKHERALREMFGDDLDEKANFERRSAFLGYAKEVDGVIRIL